MLVLNSYSPYHSRTCGLGAMTEHHYDIGVITHSYITLPCFPLSHPRRRGRAPEKDGASRHRNAGTLENYSAICDNGWIFYGNLFYLAFIYLFIFSSAARPDPLAPLERTSSSNLLIIE